MLVKVAEGGRQELRWGKESEGFETRDIGQQLTDIHPRQEGSTPAYDILPSEATNYPLPLSATYVQIPDIIHAMSYRRNLNVQSISDVDPHAGTLRGCAGCTSAVPSRGYLPHAAMDRGQSIETRHLREREIGVTDEKIRSTYSASVFFLNISY